jgi:hypothetical protein
MLLGRKKILFTLSHINKQKQQQQQQQQQQ